jgi:hypothetical protein
MKALQAEMFDTEEYEELIAAIMDHLDNERKKLSEIFYFDSLEL